MAVTKAPAKKGAGKPKVQKAIQKTSQKAGVVPASFDVDEEARYGGECVYYNRGSGFGFVQLEESGVVPEDKVMVYWKDIETEDRWPALYKGFKCEVSLKKTKRGRETTIRGTKVTAPGGENVAIQDENEEKLEYVGDKNMRFLGNVKFYDFQKGFGYIKLQDGYAIDEAVPKELRVVRAEISAGHDAPRLKEGLEIEFGISLNKKGNYNCYNATLPGGEVISRNLVEGREELGATTYTGEIIMWSWSGYGWIKPDNFNKLSKTIKDAMNEDHEKRKARAAKKEKEISDEASIYFRRSDRANQDSRIAKGVKVTFKIYKDSQGVGAFDVECQA